MVLKIISPGCGVRASLILFVSPDESRGYMGFIQSRRRLLFCDLALQFLGDWWPLKGQILASFSHFGPVLIHRKLDHPMAGIYNTYICPL